MLKVNQAGTSNVVSNRNNVTGTRFIHEGVQGQWHGKATGPSYVRDAQMWSLHKVHAVAIMGTVNGIGKGG